MEAPLPKPRTGAAGVSLGAGDDPLKRPVPLPRTRLPAAPPAPPVGPPPPDRVCATDILRSIGTVSKQISEDVAAKVTHSAKTANEKIEKSFMDGSRFAKDTLEKTLSTSRAVRDSVTKSVMEGTRLRLRRGKKSGAGADGQRCASMPAVDVSLFDNIQFHSPLLEQKKYNNEEEGFQNNEDFPSLHLNASHLDDSSIFSNNSDSNTDTVSNFSYDSRESDHNTLGFIAENEQTTYDTPRSSRPNSIASSGFVPEVPERRKKRASKLEIMRLNSMYENWTLPHQSSPDENDATNINRPSKSTIYEFDPLNSSTAPDKFVGISNELLLLESFLIGDNYGSIISNGGQEDFSDELRESEYYNPPTPPERSDSLFPAEQERKTSIASDKDRNSNWYISDMGTEVVESISEDVNKSSNSVKQRLSSMLKLDNVLNKPMKQSSPQQKDVGVERPPVNKLPMPYFSGILTRVQPGVVEDLFKNSPSRFCVLSNQKLMCYSDPTNSILKEAYPLESISSVQVVLPLSSSTTNNSFWLELNLSSGGGVGSARRVVLGCASAAERRAWAQRLAEHLTAAFPAKHTAEYTRCGWCYLKEGVTGEWRGAWLMLVRRALLYSLPAPPPTPASPPSPGEQAGSGVSPATLDLRKARCIALQEGNADKEDSVLLVDGAATTLYLRWGAGAGAAREAGAWRGVLRLAATNNGAALHHQQLTANDVPVLVEKCLAFVCAHGSLSEGVYRRAGSAGGTAALLARLRRDAWAATLAPGACAEHDVAAALKRFFRDLPEPLLPHRTHQPLTAAMELTDESMRIAELRRAVTGLGLVARNTARRLFAHLHFVASLAAYNKMTAENLAAVWAPTIMPAALTSESLSTAWGGREVSVIRELIAHWALIWRASPAEIARDAAVRAALLRANAPAPSPAPAKGCAPAGHLRLWLCVGDTDNTIHIEVSPSKTAWDACVEAAARAAGRAGAGAAHTLMVEEVVLGGALRRALHPSDLLLPALLRWAYWDEADRKDNYLLVRENSPLSSVASAAAAQAAAGGGAVSGPLRYAPPNTKLFREHHFEISDGNMLYFKDKQGVVVGEQWPVSSMVWYWGHEPRRDPRARWALTFIPAANRSPRSKDRWFGHTVAGASAGDRARWAAALWRALHPTNYSDLPAPPLVIT